MQSVQERSDDLGVLILAAERWVDEYMKDPETHAKLLKLEVRIENTVNRYLAGYAQRVERYIDWFKYSVALRQVQAAEPNIDVLIEPGEIDNEFQVFIEFVFGPINQGVSLGALASENISGRLLGLNETSEIIQRTAKELVADLVGKRVTKDGLIVDNPRAKFRITDTIRNDIREAVATSLQLGEDQQGLLRRLKKTIKNPKRAELIARTETVNAYQRGLLTAGIEGGAVGKEWETRGANDICVDNANEGPIPITQRFFSGHLTPTAHPNCRCGLIIIYPEDPLADKIR